MRQEQGHLIDQVKEGSMAESVGIKPGWQLLRIDNQPIRDIIDYKVMEADHRLIILFKTNEGLLKRIKIKKSAGTPLGLRFEPPTLAPMQKCRNRCIFCFIDQNPPGLRNPLYLKDDDYRLSFLYGNFITLNRLSQSEIERIIKLQLSPLYTSIHTIDPKLRRVMFGTKQAEQGIINLKQMVKAGIKFHVQIVLCPGYNTGEDLWKTIRYLALMGPEILSIALVPVGLTSYRRNLPRLKKVTPELATNLIDEITELQKHFLKKRNRRFVFLADEFYNLSGRSLPAEEEYEGYPQLENGVGIARIFLDELNSISTEDFSGLNIKYVTIVTGFSAIPQVQKMVDALNKTGNLQVKMVPLKNTFFGEEVTVSGLLTGSDLIKALKNEDLGDLLFIPAAMVKEDSNLFLDEMTIEDVAETLKVPVFAANGPADVLETIKKYA
ncbi:MAG: DUF512 domain-containing protein [Bacillota bacterium]